MPHSGSIWADLRAAERRLGAAAASAPWTTRTALFIAALAARSGFSVFAGAAAGLETRDLALFFDGHLYLLIARTLPRLYAGVQGFTGITVDPRKLTAWFPLYPLLIRCATPLLGDPRAAALAVAHVAGAALAPIVYDLARGRTRRPLAAALATAALPPCWLAAGSFALADALLAALFAGAMLACLRGRRGAAVVLAAAACAAQKHGFLVLPALWIAEAVEKPGGRARYFPYLAALLPLAALQGWLWAAFGDPLLNIREHRQVFGGSYFSWPGEAWLREVLRLPSRPWRELVSLWLPTILSAPAYAFAISRLRRNPRGTIFAAWGVCVLVFVQCLGGGEAAPAQPRLMLAAVPVLTIGWMEALPDSWPAAPFLLLGGVVSAGLALRNLFFALQLGWRAASPGYFRAVKELLASPGV